MCASSILCGSSEHLTFLVAIPNLYAVQTVSSIKAADALNKALASTSRSPISPLNVLLQINTSNEDEKGGLPPLRNIELDPETGAGNPLVELALHVIRNCPSLHLQGLMTIGSLAESLSDTEVNKDFLTLVETRNQLEAALSYHLTAEEGEKRGEAAQLLVSMGMSSDFEAALRSGSDIVRVGTGIFGQRHLKSER